MMLRLRMEDEKGEFPVVDGIYEDADRKQAEDRAIRLACNERNVRYLVRDDRQKEVFSAKLEIWRESESRQGEKRPQSRGGHGKDGDR